jgi:hypothetical protein
MPIEIITCPQGSDSPEWIAHRAGIVTMSELSTVMANGRGGAQSVTRQKYMYRMAYERVTGMPAAGFQGNHHTQRGNEQEPLAAAEYESITFTDIDRSVGIIKNHGVGYSPDALVGAPGLIEIKSKLPELHLELLLGEPRLPPEHRHQCQGGLWVAEREWLDFVSFCPGLPLYVYRVYRDEAFIKQIADACAKFYDELESVITHIKLIQRGDL